MIWALPKLLFSRSAVSNTLQPHGLQHARLPYLLLCPSCSNSCSLNWWCYLTILSSAIPFSSCLQSFPASGSFPMNELFASSGQSIGPSSSALSLPMNIQDWFPLGLTVLISLQSKGLPRVSSSLSIKVRELFEKKTLPVLRTTASYEDRKVYILAKKVGARRCFCKEQEEAALMWYYLQNVFVAYRRFTLNQISYIFSGNSTWKPSLRKWSVFIFFTEGLLLEESHLKQIGLPWCLRW